MALPEFRTRIAELRREGLFRDPSQGADAQAGSSSAAGKRVDVCSNDYLGLARAGVSRETLDNAPLGAGASRLVHGTRAAHAEAEAEAAAWVGEEAALLYSCGYSANIGTIPALAGPEDLIVSDALNHASVIDGCRLSRAQVIVTPHGDCKAVAEALRTPTAGHRYVVVESVYSMDGDQADLQRLREICDNASAALYVDEAHALGVFGPAGAGLCSAQGVRADVLVGTLGKAVGAQGAFVAGAVELRTWLWNRSRAFIYSTAPSPLLCRATVAHMRRVQAANDLRSRLEALCAAFREQAVQRGLPIPKNAQGPIFPVILGSAERVSQAAAQMAAMGYLAQGIRPPTVPLNTARLRVTLNAALEVSAIRPLVEALGIACAS